MKSPTQKTLVGLFLIKKPPLTPPIGENWEWQITQNFNFYIVHCK